MSHYYKIAELITPAIAEAKLKRNHPNNRKPDAREVRRLAKIPRNKWISCASTVKHDTSGLLIDGQHRLLAIIERGEALPCDVLYDAPPELIYVVDVGRGRTLAHMLKLAGFASEGLLAAVLNGVNWLLTNDTARMHMDRAEQLLVAIPDAHIVGALEWVRSAQRQKLSNARFLGGVFLAFGLLEESYRSLSYAVINGAEPGSAAQKLREDLMKEAGSKSVAGGLARQDELLARFVSVHDAFKERRPLSKIYERPKLIESERTRVKEWFQRRLEALESPAAVAAE